MRVIVTGGAGFIGSALVRFLVLERGYDVLTIDALTYAGCEASLRAVAGKPNHRFLRADIRDGSAMAQAIATFRPDRIMHLAAESHVDRSITGAADFIQTNVVGTFVLLEAARAYWQDLDAAAKAAFRFLHVSTDEVYGSLGKPACLPRPRPTIRPRPIRRRRRRPITSPRPGSARMACRWWCPTAPTTMALITSPKSSFR
jgi:dTDP-glucose 4,6-dehydratase